MNQTSNKEGAEFFSAGGEGTNRRILRVMIWTVALAVLISLPFAPWRFSTGLLLGGLLSLLNHYWLNSSTSAAFSVIVHGAKPRLSLIHYILRYAVLVIAVYAAYQLNVVSLVATIAGLCTFVVALFIEAGRELYFSIIHREEII